MLASSNTSAFGNNFQELDDALRDNAEDLACHREALQKDEFDQRVRKASIYVIGNGHFSICGHWAAFFAFDPVSSGGETVYRVAEFADSWKYYAPAEHETPLEAFMLNHQYRMLCREAFMERTSPAELQWHCMCNSVSHTLCKVADSDSQKWLINLLTVHYRIPRKEMPWSISGVARLLLSIIAFAILCASEWAIVHTGRQSAEHWGVFACVHSFYLGLGFEFLIGDQGPQIQCDQRVLSLRLGYGCAMLVLVFVLRPGILSHWAMYIYVLVAGGGCLHCLASGRETPENERSDVLNELVWMLPSRIPSKWMLVELLVSIGLVSLPLPFMVAWKSDALSCLRALWFEYLIMAICIPFLLMIGRSHVAPVRRPSGREELLREFRWDSNCLKGVSEGVRANRAFMLEAASLNAVALQHASHALRHDREVVLEAVKQNWEALTYAADELWEDREFVLQVVKQHGFALQHATSAFQEDREVVLQAVKQDGWALKYAAPSLKEDRSLCMEAVKNSRDALKFVAPSLREDLERHIRQDREVVLNDVRKSWQDLQKAAPALQQDREVVLQAVKQNWQAIQYAAPALQLDREIVLEAVTRNWQALQYAAPALQQDREIVRKALSQSWSALQYAAPSLLEDRTVILQAVEDDWRALKYAASALRQDREIVRRVVEQPTFFLQNADAVLQQEREVVLQAVNRDGQALKYAAPALQQDRHVVLKAVETDWAALHYAAPGLQQDREVVRKAVEHKGFSLQYVSPILREIREVVLQAVERDYENLKYAAPALQQDREVVLQAVKQNGLALQYAALALRGDRDVVLKAVTQKGWALEYASLALQQDREIVLQAMKQKASALHYAAASLRQDREFAFQIVRQQGQALQYLTPALRQDYGICFEAVKTDRGALKWVAPTIREDIERHIRQLDLAEHGSAELEAGPAGQKEPLVAECSTSATGGEAPTEPEGRQRTVRRLALVGMPAKCIIT